MEHGRDLQHIVWTFFRKNRIFKYQLQDKGSWFSHVSVDVEDGSEDWLIDRIGKTWSENYCCR